MYLEVLDQRVVCNVLGRPDLESDLYKFTRILNVRPFPLVLHVSISCSFHSSGIDCVRCFHDFVSCLSVRLKEMHTCATRCHQAISFVFQHKEHLSQGGGGGVWTWI